MKYIILGLFLMLLGLISIYYGMRKERIFKPKIDGYIDDFQAKKETTIFGHTIKELEEKGWTVN